jgi:hypothetical protein
MKFKILSIALAVFIIAACSSRKKSSQSTASTAPATTTPAPSGPALPAKSKDGIFAPGNPELFALQSKYPNVTLQTLTDGHSIYIGTCVGCHEAKNIYSRAEESWPIIIDDMAYRSKLTATQKDAVYKYVLAIKATQPKDAR